MMIPLTLPGAEYFEHLQEWGALRAPIFLDNYLSDRAEFSQNEYNYKLGPYAKIWAN